MLIVILGLPASLSKKHKIKKSLFVLHKQAFVS